MSNRSGNIQSTQTTTPAPTPHISCDADGFSRLQANIMNAVRSAPATAALEAYAHAVEGRASISPIHARYGAIVNAVLVSLLIVDEVYQTRMRMSIVNP